MSDENVERLEKRARDELDLTFARGLAALVSLCAGVVTLALARTQVAFVVGVLVLLAGVGWLFAVRRGLRDAREAKTHVLTLDDAGFTLEEASHVRVLWRDVDALDITPEADAVTVTYTDRTLVLAPGFGGLALLPLREKLLARWTRARGDAQR